jgi:hypothetical protein
MNEPLPYLQRIREYYQALGYGEPYRFAQLDDIPLSRPDKPLEECRVVIVTTAAQYHPDRGEQGPGAAYNGAAKFFEIYSLPSDEDPDLRISHIAIDRAHTTAEDQGSYFPLAAVRKLVDLGEIGSIASRFHGLPTNRSQDTTRNIDCPELVTRCKEDGADIALLVPNCPVCHQSVSLAANALEQAGIAAIVSGCAKDIVEHVGVPRFLFNDFPLGNAAGPPNDPEAQLAIARQALNLAVTATTPRTTVQSPFTWPGMADWKKDYSNAALLSKEEIARRRQEFEQAKKDSPKKPDRT